MYEENYLKLLEFLHEKYPSSSVQYIGSGWSSTVFLVDEFIVRFPKQNISDYQHESTISGLLNKHISFETPNVELVLDVEFPFAKHKCISGISLDAVNFPVPSKQLAKDCANCLSQIHNISPITSVRKIPTDPPIDIATLRKRLSRYFDSHTLSKLCNEYEKTNYCSSCETVFVHGDFHFNNVVFDDNGRLKGVFDWCNSGVGEREKDFIQLYCTMDSQFIETLFIEYRNFNMIEIDTARVRQLAKIDMINKLFWADEKSQFAMMLKKRLER